MRTKFLLTTFAVAAALASCSNDDMFTNETNTPQGELVELGDNFTIASANTGATSRTHWDVDGNNQVVNYFLPTYNAQFNSSSDDAISTLVSSDKIGLCWLGNASVSDQVYTNYEFDHAGWLGKDQKVAAYDQCTGVMTNGWMYSEVKASTASAAEGDEVKVADLEILNASNTKKDADDATKTLTLTQLNQNSGIYNTKNKAIFGGDYIVYYPYNESFKDAGAIPAVSPTNFTIATQGKASLTDVNLAKATFRYGYAEGLIGGAQASAFSFNNLSGIVRVILSSSTNVALAETVDKVMLYSPASGFKSEVTLSAAKIKSGVTGADLYASTVSTSKSIVADVSTVFAPAAANATGENRTYICVTALPTTITDLKVLVQDKTTKKWATVSIGDFTVKAGQVNTVTAKMASADFKAVHYAMDDASLAAAISKIGSTATAQAPATITVLGDITLTQSQTIGAYTTVEGDKIIVPEDKVLTLGDNSTMKSTVEVMGKTCCGSATNAGSLVVNTATIAGVVNSYVGEDKDKTAGKITFSASKTSTVAKTATINAAGTVDFAGTTNILGALNLAETAEAAVATDAVVDVKGGTVENNGTFAVNGDGKFAMLDAKGETVAAAGKNFTNNGTFVDQVGAIIGGATQYMVFGAEGDYICQVNDQTRLNEAYVNKTACSTIEFIEKSVAANYDANLDKVAKHNGKDVNILVSAKGASEFTGVTLQATKAVTLGNVTVASAGMLTVAKTASILDSKDNLIGYATIAVNGDITVNGDFVTGKDVRNLTANNFTVEKGATAVFGNRLESEDKTMAISGSITNKKGGSFSITPAGVTANIAYITCKKLVEGGTFSGKPEVIE